MTTIPAKTSQSPLPLMGEGSTGHGPPCANRPAGRGFSIVELLVVIGIVALLAGLLVPTLAGTRRAAIASQCQSQLRQLALAAMVYANINDDRYPAALLYEHTTGGLRTIAWDFVQDSGGDVSPGPLWQFTDAPGEIMQDASFDGASTFGNDPFTGFNYNTTYIGAEGRFPELGPDGGILDGWAVARPGQPASRFHHPSTTALFGQGGWRGGANKFMRAPMNSVEGDLGLVYSGGQAFRLGRDTAVAWLDGHVRLVSRPAAGLLATEDLLEQALDYPRNGFLSMDDAAYDPR